MDYTDYTYTVLTEQDYLEAEKNGITRIALYQRIYCYYWDLETAKTKPMRVYSYHYRNLTDKQKQTLKDLDISKELFLNRVLNCNWSIEKAVNTPKRKRR